MVKQLLLLLPALFLVNCHTQKKLEFEPPIGATPEVIKIYEDQFKKGKALYKVHCAECHGIFTAGKDSMPNFTDSQIHVYSVNVLGKSDNHGIMKKMSVEQFNYILNFLRLRNTPAQRK